jgi:hypothetical protein
MHIEVRVPFQYATQVFLGLDEDVVCQSLVSFPRVEWWSVLSLTYASGCDDTHQLLIRSLCAYCAKAIQLLLKWQAEGDEEHCAKWPALLPLMSNRELMSVILPHV